MGASGHESLRTRAAKLAAAALALKRQSEAVGGKVDAPFSLAFFTDRRRCPMPEPILRALPAGAAVIYRDCDDPRRDAVARRYAAICRTRSVLFIVSGDFGLAGRVGAQGVHLPSRMLRPPLPALARNKGIIPILTAACHNAGELRIAGEIGADLAVLSPAFATASHPDAEELGADRFRALAAAATLPVLALGGVDDKNAFRLAGPNVAGLGAIGAFFGRTAQHARSSA